MTSRSAAGNGNGRSNTPFTTLKIAVFAPMPSASVSTATAVKPGFFSNWRRAKRRSFITQRLYRIDLRRATRRQPASEQCDHSQHQWDNGERERIGRRHTEEEAANQMRQRERSGQADENTDRCQ